MERWEHDAFLGFMAETFESEKYNNLMKAIEKDIIFSGMDREGIIEINAAKYGVTYDVAEEIYDDLITNYQ